VADMFPPGWLPHTVTRKRRSGAPDSQGDPQYDAVASTFKARVEKTDKIVKRPDGQSVQATSVFATNTECAYTDIFWLPDIGTEGADDVDDDAAARRPASIKVASDKSGRRQGWEVYFE
jgi:hypothetical protein